MRETQTLFTVPDYYGDFLCKCGSCRNPCCKGWPVHISTEEYFRLLGLKCDKRLKEKIERALRLSLKPSPESYAELSHDFNGKCYLQRRDGLCVLHKKKGEDILPAICRLYPRRCDLVGGRAECCCANSCEATVELLIAKKEPISFKTIPLALKTADEIPLTDEEYILCKKTISIMQDRSYPLDKRFEIIEKALCIEPLPVNEDRRSFLAAMHYINAYFKENGASVREYCAASEAFFNFEGNEYLTEEDLDRAEEKYAAARTNLEAALPVWEIIFEQLMVNHMFYVTFPHGIDRNLHEAFFNLAVTYAFLRFNLSVNLAATGNRLNIADFFAAMFRQIEHSNFSRTACRILRQTQTVKSIIALSY